MTHLEYRYYANQIKYLLDYQEKLDEVVKKVCKDLTKRETSETNNIDETLIKVRMLTQKYRVMKLKNIMIKHCLLEYED